MPKLTKNIIGRDDYADFPAFALENVPVKIDSGAYTSTIHCERITLNEEGELEVVFLDKKHRSYTGEKHIFSKFEMRKVRSSSGNSQRRYTIKGSITLFGKTYKTSFTLSTRTKMKYPVLLGRRLLNKRFLIDTSLSNTSYNSKLNKL
jgi:hypothetical protein